MLESRLLDHERLDAYRVALELDALVVRIAAGMGRGYAGLRDQMLRASESTVLNLAESVGREGADRANRVRISKASLFELDAALTLARNRGVCPQPLRDEARALTVRLAGMLYRLQARARG